MISSDNSQPFSRLATEIAILAVPLLGAWWFVIGPLAHQWIEDPNYTHGLFVVPMAAVMVWRRRERIAGAARGTSNAGFVLLAIGGALYLLGILAAELFTMRFSLVVTMFALVLLTQGWKRTRVLLLPLLFLLFMIPLPYIYYYKLTFPLQIESSRLAAALLSGLGMPVVRMGNVINCEGYSLEVVTACSGLRSMMTLAALAVFLTDFLKTGRFGAVVLVALSVPTAVVANTARLMFTAILSAIVDAEAADSFLHELSGVVVFLSGLIMLVIAGVIIEWLGKKRRMS